MSEKGFSSLQMSVKEKHSGAIQACSGHREGISCRQWCNDDGALGLLPL